MSRGDQIQLCGKTKTFDGQEAPAAWAPPGEPLFALVNDRGEAIVLPRTVPFGMTVLGRQAWGGELLQSGMVSRRHAKIRLKHDGSIVLTDISVFGTYVNGYRVARRVPVTLREGARIRLADQEFTLRALYDE